MVVHAYKPSTEETKAEGLKFEDSLDYTVSLLPSKKCKMRKNYKERIT
jgi:hypothetical protein